jgi:hypothetical protein
MLPLDFDASFDPGIGEVDSQQSIYEDGLDLRQFLSIDLHIFRRGCWYVRTMNVCDNSSTLDSERTVVAFVVSTSGSPFIDRMVRSKTSPRALRSVGTMSATYSENVEIRVGAGFPPLSATTGKPA